VLGVLALLDVLGAGGPDGVAVDRPACADDDEPESFWVYQAGGV
jgi:hypothetical protein